MADVRDAGPSFADGYDYTVWPALPAQLYTLSKDLASYFGVRVEGHSTPDTHRCCVPGSTCCSDIIGRHCTGRPGSQAALASIDT
jgi:hypothetical protein